MERSAQGRYVNAESVGRTWTTYAPDPTGVYAPTPPLLLPHTGLPWAGDRVTSQQGWLSLTQLSQSPIAAHRVDISSAVRCWLRVIVLVDRGVGGVAAAAASTVCEPTQSLPTTTQLLEEYTDHWRKQLLQRGGYMGWMC